MYDNMMSTSHVTEYLGAGGRELYAPFKKRVTNGCWPILDPSTSTWVIEMADLRELMVLYCFPDSNWSHKSSRISFTGAVVGSICHPMHQLSYCLQTLE